MLSKIYMFFFRSGSSVSDASAAACRLFSSEILIYVEERDQDSSPSLASSMVTTAWDLSSV